MIKVVTWILTCFDKQGTVPLESLSMLIHRLSKIWQTRGTEFMILYYKDARGNLMNYLSGNPERLLLCKTTKDGIPLILGDLIPLVRGRSYLAIAMIYTVLFSTRSLKTGKVPNVESIVAPYTGDLNDISRHMSQFWKDLGYRYSSKVPKYLESDLKMYRSKAGPNGHALVSSYIDAQTLPESLVKSLITLGGRRFPNFLMISRHPRMWNFLKENFAQLSSIIMKGKPPLIRRLSFFADKENKVRVIGILDWFSQVALKPLHDFLMNVLKRIPQDCTNDQGKFIELIKDQKIYYSIDLSNATDRFPIFIIYDLLKSKLPTDYVDAWKDVMTGYPFRFTNEKGISSDISYSVGNPMGAYSSFNSFALAHHYLLYHICKNLGKDWKALPYALLGDDIVICDEQVAERYMSLIKQLGMEYSSAKTHKSKDFYEFAKRIFYQGVEVSPFPISALSECGKSYDLLFTLIWSLKNKGSWVPKESILSTGLEFFRLVKSYRRPYIRDNIHPKAWLLLGILDIVHGLRTADDFLNEIIRTRNYRLPILSEEVCKNILTNCIVQAFADSNIAKSLDFTIKDVPLWKLSEKFNADFMEHQADLMDSDPDFDGMLIVYANSPLPHAQAAVLDEYHRLLDTVRDLDRAGEDWSFKLRTFALPRSDKSLLDKGDYILSKAARSFGNLVDEQLMILQMYPQLLN